MGVGRKAARHKRGSCCEAKQLSRTPLPGRGSARCAKLSRTHAEIRSDARDRCMVFASRSQYSRSRSQNCRRKETLAGNREKGETAVSHATPSQITYVHNGNRRIVDRPPLVYHPRDYAKAGKHVADMFHRYLHTLPEDRKVLLQRYQVVDIARKVVGVGSVGTRCAVMLLLASDDDPLFLQFKEAFPSVLEPYTTKSKYTNHGERVVTGQRMLQTASDVFLGWTRDDDNRCLLFPPASRYENENRHIQNVAR